MDNEPKTGTKLAVQEPMTTAMQNIDPEAQVAYGQKCAKALMNVINQKPKKVIINGEIYPEYEDWQTIARFFNSTVGTDTVTPIQENNQTVGYTARAVVYNQQGVIIGSAEADCTNVEKNWKNKEMFQVKSMAQTRASAKALRNVFGWVAVLAGVKATPAEEMDESTVVPPTKPQRTETPNVLASAAQKNLIASLCQQRNLEPIDTSKFTKVQAHDEIERLMALPKQ